MGLNILDLYEAATNEIDKQMEQLEAKEGCDSVRREIMKNLRKGMLSDAEMDDFTDLYVQRVKDLEKRRSIPITAEQVQQRKDDEAKFNEILNHLYDTYRKKNRDYGNSFMKTYERFGITAPRFRITDKYNRFMQLTEEGVEREVDDETVRDTLLDLANYAILTVIALDNTADAERAADNR